MTRGTQPRPLRYLPWWAHAIGMATSALGAELCLSRHDGFGWVLLGLAGANLVFAAARIVAGGAR